MIIVAVDYDPTFRNGTKLPAEREFSGLCPRIPAESPALREVWLTDKDMKGIFAGFEVDGLDTRGSSGLWGVALRKEHGVDT